MNSLDNITRYILAYSDGDAIALDTVIEALYAQLCEMADLQLKKLNPDIITPVELVHELYLKLSKSLSVNANSRMHFLAIAATAMRQLIIDQLKSKKTAKRGGALYATTLSDSKVPLSENATEALMVDAAMTKLRALDDKLATTVECRYFVGYSEKETAEALGVHVRSVRRYWSVAKKWLQQELSSESS